MSEPRLGSEVSVSNEPNLTPGDSGQDVTDLQQRLHDLGYFDESIDGQYGDTTEQAVRRYQQDRRLDQTGSVDEHTWGDIAQHERDQQYAQLQANTGADGTGQGPHLSEDGRWQWDGDQWQPAGGALLADNSPVGAAQQAGPASQPQAAQQATMQMSPDGQWWWDGANWQPTAANSQSGGLQLPTGGLSQHANSNVSSTSTDSALTGFATGSAVLTSEHQAILAGIAADLNENPLTFGGYVTLTGYADRRGDAAANQELGQQRADAVRAYLLQLLTDDETKQQIHAYSMGAPTDGPPGDVPALRKVEVEITRRTYNVHLGPGLTPPGVPTPSTSDGRPPVDLRLPPGYGQPPQDPNQINLPDWFWKDLPKRPADPPFATQLSRWLNQSLHTHDLARIGGEIAGHLGMDSGRVTHMLDDAFQKGGEAGVKAVLKAVIEGVAGPPAHAPDNPTGPAVNPVPTPQQVQTPPIPTQ